MGRFGGYEDQPFTAEFYGLIPQYAARPDVDFCVGHSCSARGKILGLGCGTGRVLVPAAAAGCRVVGLDNSENMLARYSQRLRSQAPEVHGQVRLVQGHMASFDLGETFAFPFLYVFRYEAAHLPA